MKRLTIRDEFGNADIIGVDSADLQLHLNFEEINTVTFALNKLALFEELYEDGLLVRLPCRVGNTIYVIPSSEIYGINIVNNQMERNRICKQEVFRITIRGNKRFSIKTQNGTGGVISEMFRETWFLTEDEANEKLKELEKFWEKQLSKESKIEKEWSKNKSV